MQTLRQDRILHEAYETEEVATGPCTRVAAVGYCSPRPVAC